MQKRYPGTELAMTEYHYGGTTDVSGGLAQVDVFQCPQGASAACALDLNLGTVSFMP